MLVFPANILSVYPDGYSSNVDYYMDKILSQPKNLLYKQRSEVENDPGYKQLIPYSVFEQEGKVFVYQRTKKSGEVRLHDLYSIGIGGHINPCDGEGKVAYLKAAAREIKEEVNISGSSIEQIIGVIYDSSNDVGKVHFGVVHLFKLEPGATIITGEAGLTNGFFRSIRELRDSVTLFENWSQLIIKSVF